jgi:hypothetical protein
MGAHPPGEKLRKLQRCVETLLQPKVQVRKNLAGGPWSGAATSLLVDWQELREW